MNKDEIMNKLKKILKKYPDKQREILLYIFGRDNLIKMINEPTYEELKEELGNNYDLFMYEINLCLLQKIDKAIKIIENDTDLNSQRQRQRLLEILKGEQK